MIKKKFAWLFTDKKAFFISETHYHFSGGGLLGCQQQFGGNKLGDDIIEKRPLKLMNSMENSLGVVEKSNDS